MTGPVAGRYDIEAIKRRLPHRYPNLMVDCIEESGPGYAIGIKNVTANEPFFQGHFPDRAVMPGTLIAEALMQTSAFVERSRRPDDDPGAASHAGANLSTRQLRCVGMSMKFRKAVVPGDRLRMEVRSVQVLEDMVRVKATARTAAGIVAFGTLHLVAPVMDAEDRE